MIVVCSSSKYLLETIFQAGGDPLKASFNMELQQNPNASVIAVAAEGGIKSRRIYFLRCRLDSDKPILRQSIEKFVRKAVQKAVQERYRNIAFPAIGCGQLDCSISFVAEVMVEQAYRMFEKYAISILFVIQPHRTDVCDEFRKQIKLTQQDLPSSSPVKTVSVTVKKGKIEVQMGDISAQKV